jgi:hypothetical protein
MGTRELGIYGAATLLLVVNLILGAALSFEDKAAQRRAQPSHAGPRERPTALATVSLLPVAALQTVHGVGTDGGAGGRAASSNGFPARRKIPFAGLVLFIDQVALLLFVVLYTDPSQEAPAAADREMPTSAP